MRIVRALGLRATLLSGLVISIAVLVGTVLGIGFKPERSHGVNNTVLSSITPYFGTSYISTVWTWHDLTSRIRYRSSREGRRSTAGPRG